MNGLIVAAIIHMCPFTQDGEGYLAIPIQELLRLAPQLTLDPSIDRSKITVIIKPSTEGCPPDDGKTAPGIESHQ
jgi:hypothetical protein